MMKFWKKKNFSCNLETPQYRELVDFSLSTRDIIKILAENRLGASIALKKINKYFEDRYIIFNLLEDMNIRGTQIEDGIADCDADLDMFVALILNRNELLVDNINYAAGINNEYNKAVVEGAIHFIKNKDYSKILLTDKEIADIKALDEQIKEHLNSKDLDL